MTLKPKLRATLIVGVSVTAGVLLAAVMLWLSVVPLLINHASPRAVIFGTSYNERIPFVDCFGVAAQGLVLTTLAMYFIRRFALRLSSLLLLVILIPITLFLQVHPDYYSLWLRFAYAAAIALVTSFLAFTFLSKRSA
jgi:hypothetical protein